MLTHEKDRRVKYALLLGLVFYGAAYLGFRVYGGITARAPAAEAPGRLPVRRLAIRGRLFYTRMPPLFTVFYPALWLESGARAEGE